MKQHYATNEEKTNEKERRREDTMARRCGGGERKKKNKQDMSNPYVASTKKRDFALFLRLWRTFVEVIKLRGLFI